MSFGPPVTQGPGNLRGRGRLTLRPLSDDALLRRLSEVMRQSRRSEAGLIALIAEVDARKLYAREATSSMFVYCTEVLHLSEHEAYLRIAVARASRKHPLLLTMLRDGRLHLAAIAKLAPHLTAGNREGVLKRAVHKSKLQVEELVAELIPRPDAPPAMRKLPVRLRPAPPLPTPELGPDRVIPAPSEHTADLPPAPSGRPATVEPLAPARYRVQFTASAELREKLARLQDLMRSSVPDGDLETIIDDAVTEKLDRLEAKRFAKTGAPRKTLADTDTTPNSRHIPAAVRRAVHERDEGRCTYQDTRGKRCTARDRLEFHHHGTSFGGGGDHSVTNIRLMCRTHNRLLAEEEYGKEKMARYSRPRSTEDRVSESMADSTSHGKRSGRLPTASGPP